MDNSRENMPKSAQTHRQNQLERQELLKKHKVASGLISDRFPGVAQIVFHMTYYQRGVRSVLMVRTVNFTAADYAYFHMDCMQDGCTNGGFDLTPVVAALIRDRKKTVRGKLVCDGKNAAPHHASIEYEVSIQGSKSGKIVPSLLIPV
jgi:hypothetical protein